MTVLVAFWLTAALLGGIVVASAALAGLTRHVP
jgi:hypothetical protein